jgi:predicted DNA-binding protein (UPF0251 family)
MPKQWRPGRSVSDLPVLEGWMTLEEAASELGVSRQTAHKYVFDQRPRLTTATRVGRKPYILVRTAEVAAIQRDLSAQRSVAAVVAEG